MQEVLGEIQQPRESVTTESLPQLAGMPAHLVMVRHGESEANLINRRLRDKIISDYPQGFSTIPDREIRLSESGCQQATKTGLWFREHYPQGFDVIYVSDHTRAKETVAYLCQAAGWENAQIRIDPMIGERNWGRFAASEPEVRDQVMQNRNRDPLHNPMPDGETLLETRHRSRELLDRCARQFAGKNVLVISHGEYIEALWAEVAHMHTERQIDFFKSPAGDIKNCQVVEFASVGPDNHEQSRGLRWSRSSCPQAGVVGDWGVIERRSYNPQELLEQVNRYPRIVSLLGL